MTRDIIDLNDFTVLVEEASAEEPTTDICAFDEPVIGVAFYGAGNVGLRVEYEGQALGFQHTQGLALSFYANDRVKFVHTVAPEKPLQCIVLVTAVSKLQQLPHQEGEIFEQLLGELVNPSDHYVQGPQFFMPPAMQAAASQAFDIQYQGKTRMMFFRSQMTVLLSHFFGHLAGLQEARLKATDREKLFEAKDILTRNLEAPPSLNELSRQIGLNSNKLKKSFKELFGVPVFKYLQNERMAKAFELLSQQGYSIQEAAWQVGYESLSSFSNAFAKKYGYRPSAIKK